MIAVSFDPATGMAGAPRVLFQTRIAVERIAQWQYDVAPDGRFLINSLSGKHCFSAHAHYGMGRVRAPAVTQPSSNQEIWPSRRYTEVIQKKRGSRRFVSTFTVVSKNQADSIPQLAGP